MERRKKIPESFQLSDGLYSWLKDKQVSCNLKDEVESFRDYHLAHGTLMLDWEAAFRNWIRNGIKFGRIKLAPVKISTDSIKVTDEQFIPIPDEFKDMVKKLTNKMEMK